MHDWRRESEIVWFEQRPEAERDLREMDTALLHRSEYYIFRQRSRPVLCVGGVLVVVVPTDVRLQAAR